MPRGYGGQPVGKGGKYGIFYRMFPPRTAIAATGLVVVITIGAVQTRQADPAAALHQQIDRIFRDRAYEEPEFGPARGMPQGTANALGERASGATGSENVQ